MQVGYEAVAKSESPFTMKWIRILKFQHNLSIVQCFPGGNTLAFWPSSLKMAFYTSGQAQTGNNP